MSDPGTGSGEDGMPAGQVQCPAKEAQLGGIAAGIEAASSPGGSERWTIVEDPPVQGGGGPPPRTGRMRS